MNLYPAIYGAALWLQSYSLEILIAALSLGAITTRFLLRKDAR